MNLMKAANHLKIALVLPISQERKTQKSVQAIRIRHEIL